MRVLSLGWGVQSFTLAAMAALGDIEPIAAAVHSDTTWERAKTYEFARQMTPWLENHGVRVVTVGAVCTPEVYRGESIPAYTLSTMRNTMASLGGDDTYVNGQAFRTCTDRWKIQPLRRWLQANRDGAPVDLLIGISLDEWHRAKDSQVKYITNHYPLLDLKTTRANCMAYLQKHDLPVPVKSSCVFCPYHSIRAWKELKRENGPDWEKAVQVDKDIRDARPPYSLYVHSARKPLPEAVKIPEDEGAVQLTMLEDICDSGYCFL